MAQRRIAVTSALPYANGHIHIGHLVEYLQTDMWVRFQRLRGHECRYFCADDTHGTAIMISARNAGISESEWIAHMQAAHLHDFGGFDIVFDHYGSTNSEANRELCEIFWRALREADMVHEESVEQLFDPEAGTFLADRFVKGECPKCGAGDQYGDSCDKCGAVYSPAEVRNPVSTLSGATPELRSALHLFVNIEKLHGFLDEWTQSGDHLQSEIANYLKGHFLGEPLRHWDISRPAPYFGFEIPDSPGNYWYVWFDAPIGYLASCLEWCRANGEDFQRWWRDPTTEVHHFIGKDIVYFHTLFWPAMLKIASYNLPDKVHVHGFLSVNGEKMSKSKGTFVQASTYLEHLDPAYLRYYYACKLNGSVNDLDLNIEEFVQKVNGDLVGKVVNLASRSAKFISDIGLCAQYPDDGGLFAKAAAAGERIAESYETNDFGRAMREIMALADAANEFVEAEAPWKLRKDPDQSERLQAVCTIALNCFRQIVIYLSPVLPRLKDQVDALFTVPITHWDDSQTPLTGLTLAPFQHLMQRVKSEDVHAMLEASKHSDDTANSETDASADGDLQNIEEEPLAETCSFDQFCAVDLRVARILSAEAVAKSKKLLRLEVSLGGEHRRTILAGIKEAYEPATLIGRLVVVVANLAPREMGKFGVSEGMVIAAGPGKDEIFLLSPDSGATPGQRVH